MGTEPDYAAEPYGFTDPIGWFRDQPARIFAVVGTLLFVRGWAGVIDLSSGPTGMGA